MLMDHANAKVDRIGGRTDLHRLPVEQDLPLIRLIKPVEDVHQGRFAGAIFTKQGVDFTSFNVKIDMIGGQYTGKALNNIAQFKMVNPRSTGWE